MPYHDIWDGFWMFPMMLVWLIVLAGFIYVAIRLGNEHSRHDGQ